MVTFGIDYDGTFSAAPDIFRKIITDLFAAGHRAVLVTGRSDEGIWGEEVRAAVGDLMPIVFAGMQWKREAAEAAGYPIDIWIDDKPEYIGPQDQEFTQYKYSAKNSPGV